MPMAKPYAPLAAANYIIVAFAQQRGVEHMKLQKLVYNAYGWWLAFHDNNNLLNERPQVWKFGPVFNSLYHVLKPFGRSQITRPQSPGPFDKPPTIDDADKDAKTLLEWIWNCYGHLSSFALSDMTHKMGTSWQRIAQERQFSVPFGLEIPDEYIREEFRQVYEHEFSAGAGAGQHVRERAAQS